MFFEPLFFGPSFCLKADNEKRKRKIFLYTGKILCYYNQVLKRTNAQNQENSNRFLVIGNYKKMEVHER